MVIIVDQYTLHKSHRSGHYSVMIALSWIMVPIIPRRSNKKCKQMKSFAAQRIFQNPFSKSILLASNLQIFWKIQFVCTRRKGYFFKEMSKNSVLHEI